MQSSKSFHQSLPIKIVTIISLMQLSMAYNNSGLRIMDLYENISTDANLWSFQNNVPIKVRTCQSALYLTEFGYSNSAGNLQRTYSGLIPHNSLIISFSFWYIDYWDWHYLAPDDIVSFTIDGVATTIKVETNLLYNSFCGSSYADIGRILMVYMLPHSALSLTLKFSPTVYYASSGSSYGISGLSILFLNASLTTARYAYNTIQIPSGMTSFKTQTNILTTDACHPSCKLCQGPSQTQCISCADNFYFNGTQCVQSKCLAGLYYTWNDTCINSCNFPLIGTYIDGLLRCIYPCQTSEYLYWDGSCQTNCLFPLSNSTFLERNLCIYGCGTTQYLYDNGTCLSTCKKPFYPVKNYSRSFCSNCGPDLFIMDDNTCKATCPSNYNNYTVDIYKVCQLQCNGNYIHFNGTCQSSCNSPFIADNSSGTNMCYFPCDMDLGYSYFWNGSCGFCNSPFILNQTFGGSYCNFPCNITARELYNFNGSCIKNCSSPLVATNVSVSPFCNPPCNIDAGEYYFPNGSCFAFCSDPMNITDVYGVPYCTHPCDSSNPYLYWNKSCLKSCPSSFLTVQKYGKYFCEFPCPSITPFLAWNGSCLASCPYPLSFRTIYGSLYCDNICNGTNNYLYFNQTCIENCNAPFVVGKLTNMSCDFPCEQGNYSYYNSSCLPYCPEYLITENTTAGNFCKFQCDNYATQYFYWNETCATTCDFPLIPFNFEDRMYCDFNCDLDLLEYMFTRNNSCTNQCDVPFIARNQSGGLYCDSPCNFESNFSLYQNGSCLNYCDFPFILRNISGELYCDFPCNVTENQYFFYNHSCISNCSIPFQNKSFAVEQYCDFPCDVPTPFLNDDYGCYSNCPNPFVLRIDTNYQFCDFPCNNKSSFYYYNGSCLNECPSPHIQNVSRSRNFCERPCANLSEYFSMVSNSCVGNCDFPYSKKVYFDVKYCENPCDLSQSLANKESCIGGFLTSLDTISNPTYAQVQQLSQIANNFMDETVFINTCGNLTQYSQKIMNYSLNILTKITNMLQNISLTNSNLTTISTKNFDVYGKKETDCSLVKNTIYSSELAPQLNLSYKDAACNNKSVSVSYFVLNSSMFNCYRNETSKTKMFLDVYDSAGKSMLSVLKASIKMPNGTSCPTGCSKNAISCSCENLNIFDISSQILSLFANSNIGKLTNLSGLLNWKFWMDPAFWVIFILIVWYIITSISLKKKMKDACHYTKFIQSPEKTRGNAFWTLFKITHPLSNVYLYNTALVTKQTRATLYVFRILSMLTFASMFKTSENSSIGAFMNPYLMLLPYCTFVPIVSLLNYLVSKPIKQEKEVTSRSQRIKFKLGIVLIYLTSLCFIFGIFVISANQDGSEKVSWSVQFCKVMLQDTLVSPLIFILLQLIFIKCSTPRFGHKPNFLQKFSLSMLEPATIAIFSYFRKLPRTRRINRFKNYIGNRIGKI